MKLILNKKQSIKVSLSRLYKNFRAAKLKFDNQQLLKQMQKHAAYQFLPKIVNKQIKELRSKLRTLWFVVRQSQPNKCVTFLFPTLKNLDL